MNKPIVAVDVDDVLAANAAGFIAFSNKQWGMNLTIEDYMEDWATVWGTDLKESERRAMEFFDSGSLSLYGHYPEARATLQHMAQSFELVVVTSRRVFLKPETDAWLERCFPGVFSETYYAGIWDNPDERSHMMTKTDVLVSIKAQYLIDDQPKHCFAAAEHGVQAVLYGDYKWNRIEVDMPQGVHPAKGWEDVGHYFDTIAKDGAYDRFSVS